MASNLTTKIAAALAASLLLLAAGTERGQALETDIFLTGNTVKPNVLILFDNSGSMNQAPVYDALATYTGAYTPTTVYHRCRRYRSDCTCSRTQSTWVAYSGSCGFVDNNNDGVDDRTSFKQLGNRRNYETNAPNKLEIAQSVITSLLNDPANANVRFGLMLYNGNYNINSGSLTSYTNFSNYHNDTSVMKSACQDNNHSNLITIINGLSASGGTPSANRQIFAGRYFEGTFPGYASPIEYHCQRNYVINVTDGVPEGEGDTIDANNFGEYDFIENWLSSKGDLDPDDDNKDPDPFGQYINGGSDYLDDVCRTLFTEDLRGAMEGEQNIITFTIGYNVNHQLLADAAANGGGEYFTATTADQLADALRRTLNLIITDAQSFVAPVVPVNALKRTQSGDRLYIALFQPLSGSSFWAGNIKKYGINSDGDLISPSGAPATNADGSLKQTSSSYWDTAPSGGKVTAGGVGEVLQNRTAARSIYTYLGSGDLTASSNAFTVGNTSITNALLGVTSDTERDDIIKFIRGEDTFDDDEDDNVTEKRAWILGDFIHSTPLVVEYASGSRVIIAGSNDGQLHAFDDTTGDELWAFIPPDILPRLKELTPGGSAGHPFLVDGSPRLLETESGQKIVVFGLRRGGAHYYAIDVTSKTAPQYLWHLGSDSAGMSELGQAWSEATLGRLGTESAFDYVAMFGGGYDTAFDDVATPPAPEDVSSGRAIYIVNALTGSIMHTLQPAGLNYPVSSNISALDLNNDSTLDIAYVGDLGGNMWRIDLPTTMTSIFSAPSERKMFFAPDLVLDHGFINVFFGTGDLANPLETDVENRLYLFRDDGLTGGYDESNLVDITSNVAQEGNQSQQELIESQLASSRGWYLRLTREGEKCLASPLAFFDVLFTTFTPTDDPCAGGGDARLYILGFDDGSATVDRNNDGSINASDREIDIGNSIPTEVTPTIREDQAIGYVGVGGAIPKIELPGPPLNVIPIYWREIF